MDDIRGSTRREFLRHGLGLVGVSATAPAFLSQTVARLAMAAPVVASGGKDGRILVVVQLAGGNDGLNTVVPYSDELYYKLRGSLALRRSELHKLDDHFALHPSATGLRALWDEGALAVVHGVGYPNPDRSHFVGTRIWHSASPDGRFREGWLGRYFDSECRGTDPDPRAGIALESEMPLAMRGGRFMPLCINTQRGIGREKGGKFENARLLTAEQPDIEQNSNLDFLRRAVLDADVHAREIRRASQKAIEGASFAGDRFSRDMRTIARMIAAHMPTRVYYASFGGFDTHAQQAGRHATLLRDTSAAFASFVDALRKTGNLERTLIVAFSEFGRRVQPNASNGTDHGEAAPLFIMGGGLRPGHIGDPPRLDKLHRGDLAFTTDFRAVYAGILEDWLGADSRTILGESFKKVPVIATRRT